MSIPYKSEDKKQVRKQILLLPSEWVQVENFAKQLGITRAEFCRRAILVFLKKVRRTEKQGTA